MSVATRTAGLHAAKHAHLVLTGLVAALLLVVLVQPASAAAPRLIVIEGGTLPEPILLADWDENLALMTGRSRAFQQPDDSRPHFEVLEYWLNSLPAELSPSTKLGDPQARYPYYPATGDSPAVIGGYVAEQKALDVLARHGIPTRVDSAASVRADDENRWLLPLVAAAAGVLALAVAIGVVRRVRQQ